MRAFSLVVCLFLCTCSVRLLAGQTQSSSTIANASSAQALSALQNSVFALTGNSAVNDVTLAGTAERIAGSDDETGTATYRATASANRLDLNLSGGTRSEIRGPGADGLGGNWIAPDGAVHEIAPHNLLTGPGWFPLYSVSNLLSANTSVTYIGVESLNGSPAIHLKSSQTVQTNLPTATAALLQHLTQIDLYLDTSTLLPVALGYSVHPDGNATLDIPVTVAFSDYRTVGSLKIPFHVQQYFSGSLLLDIQFQQASVNSGLSSSSAIFTIQ